MAIEIRTVRDDELEAFRDCIFTTFGDEATADPDGVQRFRALIPERQRWAAFEGSRIVATAGSFDHQICVPGGGELPIAGLTMVSVRPTHRRRGLLRQLIALYTAEVRRFGAGGLWASEAAIYGRFGFGIAAHADVISIESAPSVVLRDGPCDDFEGIDEAAARDLLPDVYARATANRPGALRRSAVWWHERRFLETPFKRAGASKRRHVLARRDGAITGYLVYRQRPAWDGSLPSGKLEIVELIACDPRAELSLWRFALSVDLFPRVSYWNAPVDDPLAWAVADPRRVVRRRTDCLYLWIDDVARALPIRRYDADGSLRIGVGGNVFELVVDGGRATCAATTRAAEVELDVPSLGAVYLGGVSFTQLARADVVRGEAAAIARADRMFASAIAPWCPEVF